VNVGRILPVRAAHLVDPPVAEGEHEAADEDPDERDPVVVGRVDCLFDEVERHRADQHAGAERHDEPDHGRRDAEQEGDHAADDQR
jgi:hypothetical protein